MGSTEDPVDGKKVAGTIFGAVFIYIVGSSILIPLLRSLTFVTRDSSFSARHKRSYMQERVEGEPYHFRKILDFLKNELCIWDFLWEIWCFELHRC
jgi:hypothetical protein